MAPVDLRHAWTLLVDPLIVDLAAAVRTGRPIAAVLRRYAVARGTYYVWLAIAHGKRKRWRDGGPIGPPLQRDCYRLALAIAQADLARAQAALRHLEDRRAA